MQWGRDGGDNVIHPLQPPHPLIACAPNTDSQHRLPKPLLAETLWYKVLVDLPVTRGHTCTSLQVELCVQVQFAAALLFVTVVFETSSSSLTVPLYTHLLINLTTGFLV